MMSNIKKKFNLKKSLNSLDHILILCGNSVVGLNLSPAPVIVKNVITDTLRDFLSDSFSSEVFHTKKLGLIKVSLKDAVDLTRHLLINLSQSNKYSSNSVSSNNQIDNIVIEYIFRDLQLDLILMAIKIDYPEWMPIELEYFYNRDISTLGAFLFRSRFNLVSAYEKYLDIKNSKLVKMSPLNLLVYTATYLENHSNYILNKVTQEETLLYSIKDKSEVANLIKGENIFENVDDILYFLRTLYLLIGFISDHNAKITLSPDLASNLGVQGFVNNFTKLVGVHINTDPLVYGTIEAKVYSHFLDNKGLLLDLNISEELILQLSKDSLSNVMCRCLDGDVNLDFRKYRVGRRSFKLDFIVTAHCEASMSIRSLWNLIGVIDSAGMNNDASITCIIDRGNDQTKHAIYAFAKQINFSFLFIKEVDFGDLSASRNFAIESSKSSYISIHDADDFISLNWLSKIREESHNFSIKNMVFHPKVNLFFGDGERVMWSPCMVDDADSIEWSNLLVDNFWTSCSAGHSSIYKNFPYELIDKKVGVGFEDWAWNVKTIENDFVHRAIPQTTLFVRLKPAAESLNKQSVSHGLIPKFSARQIDMIIDKSTKG